ncbi:MAG TPA: restriction endonuclease subunit S [Terriglobia bacterium]|nr:restriction endonuclease subunit S [Terriglobia bacterium]
MAGEWIETELKEIAAKTDRAFAMGPFGSNIKAENYRESGVPVIRGTNLCEVGDAPFVAEDFVFLDEAKADELASSNCSPGDIVFVAQGTVGKVGIIPAVTKYNRFVLSQNLMKVTVDPEQADPRFVFYFYRSDVGQHEIMSRVNPTGVPCISKPLTSLRQFGIRLPVDVNEQRAIAHILGTLDDKIELNRCMNETLEAMARALFKSWFVDFDPVRAKAEGRDTGLPKHIANLFPNSFEDSDLGDIPKGWRLSRLGDEVETLLGGTPSRDEATYWGGNIPWINSGKANEFRIIEPSEFITQAGLDSSATKLLPARTTVIAITGATLGQVSITEIVTCANQSIVGVLGSTTIPSEFIYFWVKENIDRLISSQTGGAQQHINKNNVNELPIICPDASIISVYMRTAHAIFDRIKDNCLESRTLAALRDALLPKLISGELPIEDPLRFLRFTS